MAKTTKTKAKDDAWTAFSRYIRVRDALKTIGNNRQCKCVSCDNIKNVSGRGCIQAGHFIAGRHNSVLFHEELVHGQCYHCNIGLKGNWVEYELSMIKMYGKKRVEELKNLSKTRSKIIKYSMQDYLDIEKKYKNKLEELGGFPD